MPGGQLDGDTLVGSKAQEYRGLLKIRYPIEHGIVENWEDMERLWDFIYKTELKTPSEEVSVCVCGHAHTRAGTGGRARAPRGR